MLSIIVVQLLVIASDMKLAAASRNATQTHYSDLISGTRTLLLSNNDALSRFKSQRIPQDVDTSKTLDGLPDVSSLTLRLRENMTEGNLLETHRVNILVYKDAMDLVVGDELTYLGSESFLSDFQNIAGALNSAASKISGIMYLQNITGTCFTSQTGTLVFASDADEEERNKRDYLALLAIASYLPDTLADFIRLRNASR